MISYRGEENLYGNIWKFIDGINVMTNGIHSGIRADHDFNDKQSAGSYADVGFTLAKTNGYISAFGYSQEFDWLFLTSETTGNSSVRSAITFGKTTRPLTMTVGEPFASVRIGTVALVRWFRLECG